MDRSIKHGEWMDVMERRSRRDRKELCMIACG